MTRYSPVVLAALGALILTGAAAWIVKAVVIVVGRVAGRFPKEAVA